MAWWEYKMTPWLNESGTNELGGEGWELVSVLGMGDEGFRMMWKRGVAAARAAEGLEVGGWRLGDGRCALCVVRTVMCEGCGEVYQSETTDEEAAAEHLARYGVELAPESRAVVCDSCYEKILAWERARES